MRLRANDITYTLTPAPENGRDVPSIRRKALAMIYALNLGVKLNKKHWNTAVGCALFTPRASVCSHTYKGRGYQQMLASRHACGHTPPLHRSPKQQARQVHQLLGKYSHLQAFNGTCGNSKKTKVASSWDAGILLGPESRMEALVCKRFHSFAEELLADGGKIPKSPSLVCRASAQRLLHERRKAFYICIGYAKVLTAACENKHGVGNLHIGTPAFWPNTSRH